MGLNAMVSTRYSNTVRCKSSCEAAEDVLHKIHHSFEGGHGYLLLQLSDGIQRDVH